jgi:hypothetical protein
MPWHLDLAVRAHLLPSQIAPYRKLQAVSLVCVVLAELHVLRAPDAAHLPEIAFRLMLQGVPVQHHLVAMYAPMVVLRAFKRMIVQLTTSKMLVAKRTYDYGLLTALLVGFYFLKNELRSLINSGTNTSQYLQFCFLSRHFCILCSFISRRRHRYIHF